MFWLDGEYENPIHEVTKEFLVARFTTNVEIVNGFYINVRFGNKTWTFQHIWDTQKIPWKLGLTFSASTKRQFHVHLKMPRHAFLRTCFIV
jgi:hypothetical protein